MTVKTCNGCGVLFDDSIEHKTSFSLYTVEDGSGRHLFYGKCPVCGRKEACNNQPYYYFEDKIKELKIYPPENSDDWYINEEE